MSILGILNLLLSLLSVSTSSSSYGLKSDEGYRFGLPSVLLSGGKTDDSLVGYCGTRTVDSYI